LSSFYVYDIILTRQKGCFKNGIRGKYAKEYSKGANLIKIDKELLKIFPDEKSINSALKNLAKIIKEQHKISVKL